MGVSLILQSNSSKPLYLQIEDDIKQSVRLKKYKPGDKMLSEDELCTQYGVSRITVRRAMQDLVDAGILERLRGKGTYFSTQKRNVSINHKQGFTGYLADSLHSSHHQVLKKEFMEADSNIAARLNISKGSQVIFCKRLIIEDDIPLAIDELYVEEKAYPALMELIADDLSFYQLLRDNYQVEFGQHKLTINVSTALVEEATLLQCAAGDPLFVVEKEISDTYGVPIHYSKSLIRGDRTTYTFSLNDNDKVSLFTHKL